MNNAEILIEEYVQEMQNLAEKYMVKTPATEEDLAEFPKIKEGELINSRHPIPNDRSQAFELLKNFYGAYEVAKLKHKFIHIYHSWGKAAIEAEIHHLETFRNEALNASRIDYPEACRIAYSLDNGKRDNEKFMFLRLYHGFYNECRDIRAFFFNPWNRIQDYFEHELPIIKVYGKYFLYYEFLKEKIKSIRTDFEDPYSITWSSANYIKFRSEKIYFPFDCYKLSTILNSLREMICDENVCAVDLQNYPHNIFSETELQNYPDLACWSYNIIETWVQDVQKRHPSYGYPKLFDDFLKSCEILALEAKELPGEELEQQVPEVNGALVKFNEQITESMPAEETHTSISTKNQPKKFTVGTYAIMHVYLSMNGGQPVTQQNKDVLIKKYGYNSGQQLRNKFTFYESEDNRMEINTKNKKSAKAHIERFKDVLTLLKDSNEKAFLAAKDDLKKLEKEYNKYH